jgi:hypothetical protein
MNEQPVDPRLHSQPPSVPGRFRQMASVSAFLACFFLGSAVGSLAAWELFGFDPAQPPSMPHYYCALAGAFAGLVVGGSVARTILGKPFTKWVGLQATCVAIASVLAAKVGSLLLTAARPKQHLS